MRYIDDSTLAIQAATQAAAILKGQSQDMEWQSKGPSRDLVTKFDFAAEEMILKTLRSSPLDIVSEETRAETRLMPGRRYWVVDPIDGTVNFLSQLPHFAVSVGQVLVMESAEPQFLLGSVACPALHELFFTQGDEAAFLNGKPLKVGDRSLSLSLLGVTFPSRGATQEETQQRFSTVAALNDLSRGVLRLGSAAVQVCYAAASRLNVVYGFATNLWDVGAGLAIARAGGCAVITRSYPGTPKLDYIVGAPTAAQELLAHLQKDGLWKL